MTTDIDTPCTHPCGSSVTHCSCNLTDSLGTWCIPDAPSPRSTGARHQHGAQSLTTMDSKTVLWYTIIIFKGIAQIWCNHSFHWRAWLRYGMQLLVLWHTTDMVYCHSLFLTAYQWYGTLLSLITFNSIPVTWSITTHYIRQHTVQYITSDVVYYHSLHSKAYLGYGELSLINFDSIPMMWWITTHYIKQHTSKMVHITHYIQHCTPVIWCTITHFQQHTSDMVNYHALHATAYQWYGVLSLLTFNSIPVI